MKDIVSILLEIQPENVPVFLAGDLNHVPPMSLNNFDMSRIITDMESTKITDENHSRSSGNRYSAHVQYRSASLSINPASRAGACTDCEYIECTIAIITIVILVRSLFLVDIMCSFG